jgi:hypothetical protein
MVSSKTSYQAAGSIRELRINVCQYPERTVVSASWSTRERGDEPTQGHLWTLKHEGDKPIKSRTHAVNLALWILRKVAEGEMTQVR